MNSRASKAIRGARNEGVERRGDELAENSTRKLVKTGGESRGELTREVVTAEPMINSRGAMVDAIDHVTWDESKDEIRDLRTPVIISDGRPRKRGIQACEIQNMLGGYYVWQTKKSATLDVMTLDKIKRAGGTLTTVEDQGLRVWTNSPVLRHRMLLEKERRAWTQHRGISTRKELAWGEIFHDALKEQVEVRELDWNEVADSTPPGRIYYGEDEIYYMDHNGDFWDEMSGKQLNSDEVIAARLDEIKHLHSYDVYEKVPIEQCWDSTGRAPVKIK